MKGKREAERQPSVYIPLHSHTQKDGVSLLGCLAACVVQESGFEFAREKLRCFDRHGGERGHPVTSHPPHSTTLTTPPHLPTLHHHTPHTTLTHCPTTVRGSLASHLVIIALHLIRDRFFFRWCGTALPPPFAPLCAGHCSLPVLEWPRFWRWRNGGTVACM